MCEKCFVLLKSYSPTCSSICWCNHQRSRPSATLREQTNQCKAEYRFQSIRFNNILDTGLEEPAQLRVHLSLTFWEGQYPLLYPQLKLDCLFQYLALLGTCLGEGICTGRLPCMRQILQPSLWLIYKIQYLWDEEKQEGKKIT